MADYADRTNTNNIVLDFPEKFAPLLKPAPYKVCWGGRGGAKSESIAQILAYLGFQKKHKILCAREFQNTLKESAKALIEAVIKRMNLSWFYKVTEEGIYGANGTEFIFKGLRLNVGSLNSMYGITICWLEEGQFNSERSIEALLPTIREPGAEIWVSMNPSKKTDILYKMFLSGEPPIGSVIIHVNYYDNPWFGDTPLPALMEATRLRDPAKYRHVWLGELDVRSDAIVFNGKWRTGEMDVPPDMRPLLGCDWGFSVDPTVLVKCYVFKDTPAYPLLYIEREVVGYKTEIDDLPALFDQVQGSRFHVITADSSRPELISHMRRNNYRVHPSVKGAKSVIEGVEFMRSYDIMVNPECTNITSELEGYSYDIDKEGNILSNLVPGKDHGIDACRYALEAERRGQLKVSVRQIAR